MPAGAEQKLLRPFSRIRTLLTRQQLLAAMDLAGQTYAAMMPMNGVSRRRPWG